MNYVLTYYNYPQCYAHYTERLITIRQAKIRGEIIVAKPVLLLALIDGIEAGVFRDNRFTLNAGRTLSFTDASVHPSLTIRQTNRNQQSILAPGH